MMLLLVPALLPLHNSSSNNNSNRHSNRLLSLLPPHFPILAFIVLHNRSLVRKSNGRRRLHLALLFAVEWKNGSVRLAYDAVTQAAAWGRQMRIHIQMCLVRQ